jgi:hypothetical protein
MRWPWAKGLAMTVAAMGGQNPLVLEKALPSRG